MRHYATSWKVDGSIPNEVIGFFQHTHTFQTQCLNRNEYQEYSWGVKGGWWVRLDNLTTLCEPIV
jgi:hypothetical protein